MFTKNRIGLALAALLVLAIGLVACQPQSQVVEVTRIVTETVTEEGQQVEVTRVVTETEEVVVTATPEPVEEVTFTTDDPSTMVIQSFGDIGTLDPALGYDTGSNWPMMNIYETLIWYNGSDPVNFVPVLATEVPSVENGGISEDGLTYTFNIREGITFHDGAELTASDVAYSLQRLVLSANPDSPGFLLLEPVMDVPLDITEVLDPTGALEGDAASVQALPADQLAAVCDTVQSRIVADDAAGTVTITLAKPWGPLLASLAQTWGGVLDSDWAAANGAWDGDCATWQNFYALGQEGSTLSPITNGTGPYMLDHWTPGEEWVLTANPNYWRSELNEPLWEGGPSGAPQIETVIVQMVDEFGTRFASLQAGDAANVAVNIDQRPQVDPLVGEICLADGTCTVNEENPDGPLRKWDDLPSASRTDMFPTWNVAADSPYIGSGQLDGNGIPPDFFSDINVRKAMATCFDYDTYIAEALQGEGVRNNGPIIVDMLGYNPDGPMYEYDPEACAGYLAEAWDGQLPTTGFRFQIAYNAGNSTRQTVAEILQSEVGAVAEEGLYNIEVVSLPWPSFLAAFRAGQLPVSISGWIEDIHDPHNWVGPYTYGTFGARQALPDDILTKYQEAASAAATESDPAVREQMYFDIQQMFYDDAISVILAQATGARYEQRWVNGYFYNPITPGTYFYGMSLTGQ
jgi:peptide/nickel transport system substrate-binding protein